MTSQKIKIQGKFNQKSICSMRQSRWSIRLWTWHFSFRNWDSKK